MGQLVQFTAIRFVMALLTLFIVSFIVFGLMELVPGNCAERYVAYKATQGASISQADIVAEEIRMGLDRPFVVRWVDWTTSIFIHGDLGESCLRRLPVTQILKDKVWISLGICFAALLITYMIAVPLGMLSANIRNSVTDSSLRFLSYLGLALPNFMIALCIMLIATIYFGDTLTGLFSSEYRDAPWSLAKLGDFLSRAWLPAFILGWSSTALQLQTVRALMSDEVGKLYVTAARARGISGPKLFWRYPARHALGPVVNSVGFDLNRIFNDLPIVAAILVMSEAGFVLLEALAISNDQELAGAIIFLLTAAIVTLNFASDVLLAIIDPRVRRGVV
ncbi:ABC transporter permease [Coralliovum pocilloporae]|uniref:ABC transporter permease n=1 Tax=Coralliovum pocilloporae TaxID=3066369 RepID=UPI00330732D7